MGKRGDDRTQRVVIGIGLGVLALFCALSLIPSGWIEELADFFPSGNVVGPVGAVVASALLSNLGIVALLVPLGIGLASAWSFEVFDARRTLRAIALVIAILVFTPPLVASLALPANGASASVVGDYGLWGASTLASGLGWLGSSILLSALLVSVLIATIGLEPFRRVRRGARVGWTALASTIGQLAAWLATGWETLALAVTRMLTRAAERVPRPGFTSSGPAETQAALFPPSAQPEPARKARRRKNGRRSATTAQADLFAQTAQGEPGERPPISLLSPAPAEEYSVSEDALDELGEVLIDKLRTFRVEGEIGGRTTGPVVTRFEVVPASGVKVGRIAALADDLALALRAPSVRIIAPIPGKGAVGVEVPNPERKTVYLRSLLESSSYQRSRAELPLALGEDVNGRPYVADLSSMPHLLIAGVTGSGKSVCINSIITSLIYRHTPEGLRLLLIDPKMVELAGYNVLPHLRHSVVTDNADAATALKWCVYEMERRYAWLSENRCRNISEFNRRVSRAAPIHAPGEREKPLDEPKKFPYIVLVIDELADLMMTVQSEVERPLAFLAQKARATGVHLVVATQRPSVNVITGLIKANFPCRIAFRVASKVDSRTILDQNGADTLLGNGDMLFLPPGSSEPMRLQGTFLASGDTEKLIDWYATPAEPAEPEAEEDILEAVRERELEEAAQSASIAVLQDVDPLFRQAAEVVIQHQGGSTSLLQRRLKIGYGRAARIVDQLHDVGVLGPPEGSKPREILVTLNDLDRLTARPD